MVIELANAATFLAFCGLMYAEQVRYEGEGGGEGGMNRENASYFTRVAGGMNMR